MSLAIPDISYRCPQELAVSAIPLHRVMVIGSCLISGFPIYIESAKDGCPCDYLLVNNAPQLPQLPPHPIAEYDFQLLQIPLRTIMPDGAFYRLPFHDVAAHAELFEQCCDRIAEFLAATMRWNLDHGVLTFVWNFLLPQQNAMSRLLPRYDLRNPVSFIEKLNEFLAQELQRYSNAYLFDNDQLVSTFGRRYFQDDAVWALNHNAALGDNDFEHDSDRLEGAHRASDLYPLRIGEYLQSSWAEILAMYRTVRQADQVKLVIVDIDDTLWRGVAAELPELPSSAIEGWPLGIAEALGYLKRRGVLLALVSRNDEARVAEIWSRSLAGRLELDDFAVRKINWRPKAENVEELLRQVNLLPHSVVFIDDNPVERAAVAAAFPGIRTFGPNPLLWRRILLWSPETQVATITAESATRTEMMQAQAEREDQRQRLTREEFLASLDLRLRLIELDGVRHPAFPRAIELINKTNQFNTTGRRWTELEFRALFESGGQLFTFAVEDRFTAYGVVGVIVAEGNHLSQFVMSCRVIGLDVEIAAIAELLRRLRETGADLVSASLTATPLNLLSRDLYQRCGFDCTGDTWLRPTVLPVEMPAHVRIATGQNATDGRATVALA